jgi:hypothetical protein
MSAHSVHLEYNHAPLEWLSSARLNTNTVSETEDLRENMSYEQLLRETFFIHM